MSGVVNCAAYAAGRRVADVRLHEVVEVLRHEVRFIWIGLHEPEEELLPRSRPLGGDPSLSLRPRPRRG